MKRQIKLSIRTKNKPEKLLEYLEINWSEKVKKEFVNKLDHSLSLIQQNPDSFQKYNRPIGLQIIRFNGGRNCYYREFGKINQIINI